MAAHTTTIAADGAWYLQAAKDLYQRQIQVAFGSSSQHPLHMILTASLGDVLGSVDAGAYSLAVVAASLALLPLFHIVRSVWDRRVAWGTCLLYALHPSLTQETSEVLNTSLYMGLFIGTVSFVHLATKGGPWLSFPLAGILGALCYLTRPEAVVLVLYFSVSIVAALISLSWRGALPIGKPWYPRLRLAAGFFVAAVVFVGFCLPYLVWMHRSSGKWCLTRRSVAERVFDGEPKGVSTVSSTTPGLAPSGAARAPEKSAEAPPSTLKVTPPAAPATVSFPGPPKPERITVAGYFTKVQRKYRSAIYPALVPFLVIGFWASRKHKIGFWRSAPLWGAALASAAPALIFLAILPGFALSERYFLLSVVFLLPWIAAGLLEILGWVSRIPVVAGDRWRLRTAQAVPCLVLLALFLLKTLPQRRVEEHTFLEAGRWLQQHGPPTPRFVLSTTEKIPYYGGYRPYWVREGAADVRWNFHNGIWDRCESPRSPDSISDRVRTVLEDYNRERAAFLVLHDRHLAHRASPEFVEELQRVGFEQVAMIDKGSQKEGSTVWIYQLRPSSR